MSFYSVFILAALGGVALDFMNIDPIKALYWTAILNGLLAPFLLLALLLVSNDENIMQGQCSSSITRHVVMLTTVVMFAAGIAMFLV